MFILRLKLCSNSFLNVIKSRKKFRPSSYPRISVNLKMFKRVNQNQSPFFGETVQQLTSKNGFLILHSYISCNYCIKSFLKGMGMLLSLFLRIDFFSFFIFLIALTSFIWHQWFDGGDMPTPAQQL